MAERPPASEPPLHPALRRNGTGIEADGEFYMPTRALFGRGIASQAAEHVGTLGIRSNPRAADATAYRAMFAREARF